MKRAGAFLQKIVFEFYFVQVEIRTTSPLLGFRIESQDSVVSLNGLNGAAKSRSAKSNSLKELSPRIVQKNCTENVEVKQLRH